MNIKRAALYLRLSKEDIEKETETMVSESIKNQKQMLLEEVQKHPDWKVTTIYCDEDFSGIGTYRPDFEKMIKDCENGKIDIILCKSQSRFSRDIETIEKYLHNKFIEWNIRFISLTDHTDTTKKENKKQRQINALMNEWFLEDLSDNIKATLRSKWKAGESTAAFAKYGLLKDPKNKNHLLIDPIASKVLKKIASLILAGYGQEKIATILEEKKIPCPYEYKQMNGCKLQLPITKEKININKTGTYIIKISLRNEQAKKIQQIKSLHKIKPPNEKVKINIHSIPENIELFYTTKKDIENEKKLNFKENNWIKIEGNKTLPKNIWFLASNIKNLPPQARIEFELELTLLENKEKNTYQIITQSNKKINCFCDIRKKYHWNGKTIYHMMKDKSYNGTLIQGKTKRISYKNHKCIKTASEDWVVKEKAIEKIFDDKTWNLIQEKLKEKSRAQKTGKKHIFHGKAYCACCGNILHKNCSYSNHQKTEYLLCKDKQNKWKNCDNQKAISLDILQEYILQEFNQLLNKYYDHDLLEKKYQEKKRKKNQNQEIKIEQQEIQKQMKANENILKKLYEDKIQGILDKEEFLLLKTQYKEKAFRLRERLEVIKNELETSQINEKKKEFFSYQKQDILTQEIVNEFINKITVDKIKCNQRSITIFWNI